MFCLEATLRRQRFPNADLAKITPLLHQSDIPNWQAFAAPPGSRDDEWWLGPEFPHTDPALTSGTWEHWLPTHSHHADMITVLRTTIRHAQMVLDAKEDRELTSYHLLMQEESAFNTTLATYTENLRTQQAHYAADLATQADIMERIATAQADLLNINHLLTAHPATISRIQEEQGDTTGRYQLSINNIHTDHHTREHYITQHFEAANQALHNHANRDPEAYNDLHQAYITQPPHSHTALPLHVFVMPGTTAWEEAQHFPYQVCALTNNRYDATSPSSWLPGSPSSSSYQ